MRWQVGVVDIVYADLDAVADRATAAAADGYEHIDPRIGYIDTSFALPIGCPTAFPKPVAGWCATPSPPRVSESNDGFERALRWWRAAPDALLEPWAGGAVATWDEIRALRAELPRLRLLVDTGHIADMGGDPCEYLALASHVQLRQGCAGHPQLHVDDSRGTVDVDAVARRLEQLDYQGLISIEYFDLPEQGWSLDEPRKWALDLACAWRAK